MENPDFVKLVRGIYAGEQESLEQFYKLFQGGIRYYLARQVGPNDIEDKIHDTFVIVVNAIRRGELREPERLMGFVRTVVRRQVAGHIEEVVHSRASEMPFEAADDPAHDRKHRDYVLNRIADNRPNPEQSVSIKERAAFIRQTLDQLKPRDREILERFYLLEQKPEQICREMKLTENQFRLYKSRAKDRFSRKGLEAKSASELKLIALRKWPAEKLAA